jgi:hypothetical protein
MVGCFLTSAVVAQDIDITRHPGYIDLEEIKVPDNAGQITDIDLGPALLRLALWAEEETGVEDLQKSLSGLLSLRVKSFDIHHDENESIRAVMEKIDKKLKREKWEMLVRVKSEDVITNISLKTKKGKIVGFFLMSMEAGDKVAFANIVGGNIDLESIKNMGLGLKEAGLDSLWKDF